MSTTTNDHTQQISIRLPHQLIADVDQFVKTLDKKPSRANAITWLLAKAIALCKTESLKFKDSPTESTTMSHPETYLRDRLVVLSERACVTASLRQEMYNKDVKNKPSEHWRGLDNRVAILTDMVETLLKDQADLAVQLRSASQSYPVEPEPRYITMEEVFAEMKKRYPTLGDGHDRTTLTA